MARKKKDDRVSIKTSPRLKKTPIRVFYKKQASVFNTHEYSPHAQKARN